MQPSDLASRITKRVNLTPADVIAALDLYEIRLADPNPDTPTAFIQGGPAAIEGPPTREKAFDEIVGVIAELYSDEVTAETKARGPADFDGRKGERVQVRNVLIWFDPALSPKWQGRVRSAIETLRSSQFGVQS